MTSQTLSRRIRAPEDIRIGDYIAVTHTRYQLLPDFIEAGMAGGEIDTIGVTVIPHDAGRPLKVVALSLPFLICKTACGTRETIDTRRHALVRVDRRYAKAAVLPDPKKSGGKRKGKRKRKKKSK